MTKTTVMKSDETRHGYHNKNDTAISAHSQKTRLMQQLQYVTEVISFYHSESY